MTNIDIVNGLVFQALRINKETFDERLVSQKKVFLLQEMGVDIGYSYNWYVRGPYSPDLATYIFSNLDVLKEQDFSKYHLTESVQKNIDAVNNLGAKKPDSLSLPSWYELLASVVYIHKKWNKTDVFNCLIQYKPQYTQEHYEAARQALMESGCYA